VPLITPIDEHKKADDVERNKANVQPSSAGGTKQPGSDVSTLTPLSPAVMERQATINIGPFVSIQSVLHCVPLCGVDTDTLWVSGMFRHNWPCCPRQVHHRQGDYGRPGQGIWVSFWER